LNERGGKVGLKRLIENIKWAKTFLNQNYNLASSPHWQPKTRQIVTTTGDGKKIVAKINFLTPELETDLGKEQKKSFFIDVKKLKSQAADYKYFFVTDSQMFKIIEDRYLGVISNIIFVSLPAALHDQDKYVIKVINRSTN
jgi:hypothetical protein